MEAKKKATGPWWQHGQWGRGKEIELGSGNTPLVEGMSTYRTKLGGLQKVGGKGTILMVTERTMRMRKSAQHTEGLKRGKAPTHVGEEVER